MAGSARSRAVRGALALLALALAAPRAAALSYESVRMELSIVNETATDEDVDLVLLNDRDAPLQTFNYTVSGLTDIRGALVEGRRPSYEIHRSGSLTQLRLELPAPVPQGGRQRVTLSLRTSGHVERDGERFMFSRSFGFKSPVQLLRCSVVLPAGAMLPVPNRQEAPALFFPKGDISHDGRQLKVTWTQSGLKPDEPYVTFILYEFPPKVTTVVRTVVLEDNETKRMLESSMSETRSREEELAWERSRGRMLQAFVLLETAALALVGYFHLVRRAARPAGISPLILESLDDDESGVLSTVAARSGPITQREVQELLGYSKAKLSRTLDQLEAKGFIRRVRFGRTNKVNLTDKALR